MPNNIENVINIFITEIKYVLGDRLKKIILYGSYARGDYSKTSDIDIMILTNFSEEEIEEYRDIVSDIAFEIELNNDVSLSPIIKNEEKFKKRIEYIPFYKNVEKEGVVLFER